MFVETKPNMTKKAAKSKQKRQFSVYLDGDLCDKITAEAIADRRSVNQIIEKALEEKYSTVKL